MANSETRPSPDELLAAIERDETAKESAQLRIFLGMSAGVGKTYAMLKAAHRRLDEGCDVLIGLVETHGRKETAALLDGLQVLPRKQIEYRGTILEELDVDAILARRPQLVVIDEMPHSNAPGSRHPKRYQDIVEILDAGIDVYSALNVQHLESRKESVEAITQVTIRETVPDSMLDRANQVELVDIAPSELLKRLKEGKVYLGDKAERAAQNFFKEDRLTALREISLRLTAERVDQDLQRFASVRSNPSPWQTNERLMVAVSHSPHSERLIRATRRLAYNLEAPWIAVHVDNGVVLSTEDQLQLTKNLALARELKGELITTSETDITFALRRIARQKNVTQIMVGRPAKRWFRDRIEGGSLLDRLVHETAEVDVHVLSQEGRRYDLNPVREWRGWFQFTSKPIQYWNTFCFLIGTAVFAGVLNSFIEYRAVAFVFLLAVVVVGLVGSMGTVLFAAFLSVIAWDFFFIPPQFTFQIGSGADLAMSATFLVVAIILGYSTNRIRLHEKMLREREERTNVLYEILKDVTAGGSKADFLAKTVDRVGRLLGATCGIFLADDQGKLVFDEFRLYGAKVDEKGAAVATWAFESAKPAGWSTDTLTESPALYIPLKGRLRTVGIFVFLPQTRRPLNVDQETLLFSVCSQLGISLERHFIEKKLVESKKLEDSEKLHQTLLNSISHEMRTPLTAILGTASALQTSELAKNSDFAKSVADQLIDSGDRLNRVIENLLDMSRLNSGVLQLKLDWYDVGDLVRTVLEKNSKLVLGRKISVEIDNQVPFVKMDVRLMEHALSNLLVNASMYTPPGSDIEISALHRNGFLEIVVRDHGLGIPAESLGKVFEKFYRVPGSPTGGTGVGLSIVKSIVEAHEGTVHIESEAGLGARFTIALPASEPVPQVPLGRSEREGSSNA